MSCVHSCYFESDTSIGFRLPNVIILSTVIRYDSTTGTFTVPPGGDGFYYFSAYLVVEDRESGVFDIELNDETICTAFAQQIDTLNNEENTSCNAAVYVTEGASLIHLFFKITFSLLFGLCIIFFILYCLYECLTFY